MVYALEGDTVDAREFIASLRAEFSPGSCIFGALYSNRAKIVDSKRMREQSEPV